METMDGTDRRGQRALPTLDAPGGRATAAEVKAATEAVKNDKLLTAVLEAVPGLACVLNEHRQIVAANSRMVAALGAAHTGQVVGNRLGEAIGCIRARETPTGCGTSAACHLCGALDAVQRAQGGQENATGECRFIVDEQHGFAYEAEVVATPVTLGGTAFVVVTLRDRESEGRRRVLEKLFFHDILNTAGGVRGVASMLGQGRTPQAEEEYRDLLLELSERLIDLIAQQRQLLAAESGDLQTQPSYVLVSTVLHHVQAVFSRHDAARDRTLVLTSAPDVELVTDVNLLQRVLGNLVKNALEATPPRGTVTISARATADHVAFMVHNPGAIPPDVAHQIFQRSFSTKGAGRGLGTYSIRLLGEGYLGGRVSFTSTESDGTTFTFVVPKAWSGKGADPDAW